MNKKYKNKNRETFHYNARYIKEAFLRYTMQ